jgi:nucleoid-associated protein YgaU
VTQVKTRTAERMSPARAAAVSGYRDTPTRPGRAGARVRRARRARRAGGLLRFAVFLLLVFVAVWAGVRVANATDASDVYDGRAYEVHSGDTLWQIAASEYDTSLDLRAVVYAIREANGLDGALLQPGQKLTLPYMGE